MNPPSTFIADLVSLLDANLREDFEERAGIIEFDANQPRAFSECLALLDVLRRHPGALLGLTVLQVDLNHETRFVLTTDSAFARQHLQAIDVKVIGPASLSEVIKTQFKGVALMFPFG